MRSSNESEYFMLIPGKGFSLDKLEKDLVTQALEKSRYNKTKAAKILGITRSRLRSKLKKHKIK